MKWKTQSKCICILFPSPIICRCSFRLLSCFSRPFVSFGQRLIIFIVFTTLRFWLFICCIFTCIRFIWLRISTACIWIVLLLFMLFIFIVIRTIAWAWMWSIWSWTIFRRWSICWGFWLVGRWCTRILDCYRCIRYTCTLRLVAMVWWCIAWIWWARWTTAGRWWWAIRITGYNNKSNTI